MEVWQSKDGSEVAVIAATWELNPKVTFASLSAEFKANPVKAWRNFGSRVGKGGTERALRDPEDVERHINTRRADPWDYTRDDFQPWFLGNPSHRYYIHIDLAESKDTAGVAVVHREPTGVVVVDFMHGHKAKPGQNIQFEEMRAKYVYGLHARGFRIAKVTFDQWQSVDMRQILEGKGFETDLVSADKTTGPYDTVIEMVLTDRLDYYNEPQFIRELQQLRTNGVKYDHPKTGGKDVSDAVACATFTIIEDLLDDPPKPPGKIRVRRAKPHRPYERSKW